MEAKDHFGIFSNSMQGNAARILYLNLFLYNNNNKFMQRSTYIVFAQHNSRYCAFNTNKSTFTKSKYYQSNTYFKGDELKLKNIHKKLTKLKAQ